MQLARDNMIDAAYTSSPLRKLFFTATPESGSPCENYCLVATVKSSFVSFYS